MLGNVVAKTDQSKKINEVDRVLDSEWLKSSFIIPDKDIVLGNEYTEYIRKNRYYSTADMKVASTSPGMSMGVNPKPQFTRYCDIRSPGKLKSRPDHISIDTRGHPKGLGMGRYYSEAIDDNQQRIFMRFGVPKYMPLYLWLYKSFDIDKVVLQNRGLITSTILGAVGVVSKLFAIGAAPLLALGMYTAKVIVQNSRFYSVKETMYLYWATVENILNAMTARRTMVPYILPDYSNKLDGTMDREQTVTQSYVQALNALIPDVIDPNTGRISVFAIALRGQAAFNKMQAKDMELNSEASLSRDFTGYRDNGETGHDTYFTNNKGEANLSSRLFKYAYDFLIKGNKDEEMASLDPEGSKSQSSLTSFDSIYTDTEGKPISLDPDTSSPDKDKTLEQRVDENLKKKSSTFDKYKEYMLAELSEGAAFAIFNVDSTGSVGESFSNSSTSNPIESTFNAISSKARNIGNLLSAATDIPVVSDVLKLAADAGATVLSNASFGIVNPLLALAYGVNITMPKVWESSSASLPRASYKIKLISPYGNPYSQLFNIYLPLAMVLAGSLPRSTGSSSYTSPFMCQLFDRGRVNIQLGMIDNVSITRGTSNLGFGRNGHANAIDLDISVANLDEIISVDVTSNGVVSRALEALNPDFSDTPFTNYLNTITGVDVYTQIYRTPRMRLKLAERYMVLNSIANPDPAAFAAFTVDTIPGLGLVKELYGNNAQALRDLIGR